ncbi:AAA family ATPase [Candidatus Dependentiae bacterium]|nr:AAA family ATPase [Candidatus Dependentiae bacterium]
MNFLKLIVLMSVCLASSFLCADESVLLDIGGVKFSPEAASKMVAGSVQVINEIAQRKREKIEKELAVITQERAALGAQKDLYQIGQSEFEQKVKALDQKAARLERCLENSEKAGEQAAATVQNAMLAGWNTFLDVRRDEATRKTQIAVAGVSKAVENEGALQRLEFLSKKMTEPETLVRFGGFMVLTSCGMVGGYYGLRILSNHIQSLMGMPTLVRESSRKSAMGYWMQSINEKLFGPGDTLQPLEEIILSAELDLQIKQLADDVRTSYISALPFRNLLLYGPPGTGKTMIAKAIARTSDLDFACVSGADFSQFAQGNDVEQLHILLDWAAKSERGLVLFVDEVDAFARRRDQSDDRWVKLLNAFLSRTGELSEKFMIIAATNHLEMLDNAFLSRMHKRLYVGLPGQSERVRMIKQYLEKYIAHDKRTVLCKGKRVEASLTISADVDETYLEQVAERIQGFAGRDIAFMIDELRAICYRSPVLLLTRNIFDALIDQTLHNRAQEALVSGVAGPAA